MLNEGTLFCSQCGTGVPQVTNCVQCQQVLAPQDQFCNRCGTPVKAPEVVEQTPVILGYCSSSGKAIRIEDEHFRCMECNNLHMENYRFEDNPVCQSCANQSGVAQQLEKERNKVLDEIKQEELTQSRIRMEETFAQIETHRKEREAKDKLNQLDSEGETPLTKAILECNLPYIKELLQLGVDIEKPNNDQRPLEKACCEVRYHPEDSKEIIFLLLQGGAAVCNLILEDNDTLVTGIEYDADILSLLLEHKMSPDIGRTDIKGRKVQEHMFLIIMQQGWFRQAKEMLLNELDLNKIFYYDEYNEYENKKPIIHFAFRLDDEEDRHRWLRLMIENGYCVNCNAELPSSAFPLVWQECFNYDDPNDLELFELSISNGADFDYIGATGETFIALLIAGYGGKYIRAVKLMLDKGASPDFRYKDGTSLVQLCRDRNDPVMKELLTRYGS